jgi:hypothetical protein
VLDADLLGCLVDGCLIGDVERHVVGIDALVPEIALGDGATIVIASAHQDGHPDGAELAGYLEADALVGSGDEGERYGGHGPSVPGTPARSTRFVPQLALAGH